jgi:hypothetical protein
MTNRGNIAATNVVIDATDLPAEIVYNGATNITNISGSSSTALTFDFTPPPGLGAPTIYSGVVDFTYETGSRILTDPSSPLDTSAGSADYTLRTVTNSILVIFEAVPASEGAVTITSQTYQVDYDPLVAINPLPAGGINNPTEVLLPANSGVTIKYNAVDAVYVDLFKAIKGSPIYVKKMYTLENTGGAPLNDLTFSIKASATANVIANTTTGDGYSIYSNTCVSVTLAATETCTFEINFLASALEASTRNIFGHISYAIAQDQYISQMWTVTLEANDPATVRIGDVNPFTILDEFGGIIEGAFPIDLGDYPMIGLPTLNDYPIQAVTKNNITVENQSLTKASFLREYRTYVGDDAANIPPGVWTEIYNANGKIIDASRGCFYGDDEGLATDPDTWGFNSATTNTCEFNLTYNMDDKNIGEWLPEYDNYLSLNYYDNERNSSSKIYLFIRGFVQPNKSTVSTPNIYNVTAQDDGTVYFEWDASVSDNTNWGSVLGYRVFYATNPTLLQDIYNNFSPNYVDTTTPSVTINNLAQSKLYYFKIVARRQTPVSIINYFSDISNMPLQKVIVPPADTIYNHQAKIIIDTYMSPQGTPAIGTKSQSTSTCTTEKVVLSAGGSNVTISKQLIGITVFNIIDSDPSYSSYPYDNYPHWMSDVPTSIAPYFPDYVCSDTSGSDIVDNEYFQKTCSDCSCDSLSVLKGGDGFFLPIGATIYSEGETNSGAARCFTDVSTFL